MSRWKFKVGDKVKIEDTDVVAVVLARLPAFTTEDYNLTPEDYNLTDRYLIKLPFDIEINEPRLGREFYPICQVVLVERCLQKYEHQTEASS